MQHPSGVGWGGCMWHFTACSRAHMPHPVMRLPRPCPLQVFNKQITLFREAVYLLFGYRVEMASDPGVRGGRGEGPAGWNACCPRVSCPWKVSAALSKADLIGAHSPAASPPPSTPPKQAREFKAQFALRPQHAEGGADAQLLFRMLRDGRLVLVPTEMRCGQGRSRVDWMQCCAPHAQRPAGAVLARAAPAQGKHR